MLNTVQKVLSNHNAINVLFSLNYWLIAVSHLVIDVSFEPGRQWSVQSYVTDPGPRRGSMRIDPLLSPASVIVRKGYGQFNLTAVIRQAIVPESDYICHNTPP